MILDGLELAGVTIWHCNNELFKKIRECHPVSFQCLELKPSLARDFYLSYLSKNVNKLWFALLMHESVGVFIMHKNTMDLELNVDEGIQNWQPKAGLHDPSKTNTTLHHQLNHIKSHINPTYRTAFIFTNISQNKAMLHQLSGQLTTVCFLNPLKLST